MIAQKCLLKYYKEAVRRKANTHHALLEQLECRLDNVVYRLKLAQTIFHAQQLVAHGHILVDGRRVNIRSFQVKPGMIVSVKAKSHKNPIILQALENKSRELPEYLEFDEKKLEGKMLVVPGFDQVSLPLPINIPLVCEFLAHTN